MLVAMTTTAVMDGGSACDGDGGEGGVLDQGPSALTGFAHVLLEMLVTTRTVAAMVLVVNVMATVARVTFRIIVLVRLWACPTCSGRWQWRCGRWWGWRWS